jgi:hypothetical protein
MLVYHQNDRDFLTFDRVITPLCINDFVRRKIRSSNMNSLLKAMVHVTPLLTKNSLKSLSITSKSLRNIVSEFENEASCNMCYRVRYFLDFNNSQTHWCNLKAGYVKDICIGCGHYSRCYCNEEISYNSSRSNSFSDGFDTDSLEDWCNYDYYDDCPETTYIRDLDLQLQLQLSA